MGFTIRDLTSYDELLALTRLQREIWGLEEPGFGLYPPLLLTAAKNGGLVLGAFANDTDQMIGFLFGFLGREPSGPLKLCSQTMGVLKAWRGHGVAEALKQMQRQRAIAQGLPLITWTYDPLEGPNAHLNLHKLRAISRTYWCNLYGTNFGTLNAGLPTDRLVAEWWINGSRLADKAAEVTSLPAAAPVFEVTGTGVQRRIVQTHLNLNAASLQIEVPANIHQIKAADLNLALEWRLQVRQVFETCFARGYLVTDFISIPTPDERRNFYLLQKSTPELLINIGIAPAG